MHKLVDLVIILSALVGMRRGHLVDFQIKSSSSSSLIVKMMLQWEIIFFVGSFLYADFLYISCLHFGRSS